MIKEATTFILGAGASKPYGFPLGNELLHNIAKSLNYKPAIEKQKDIMQHRWLSETIDVEVEDNSRSSNKLFQLLLNSGYNKTDIECFSKDLVVSGCNSVDAFLEYRTDFIDIGKRAIAYNLVKYENEKMLLNTSDWYNYIWQKMISPFDEFSQNKVSFITFNYDRSLEYYLILAMSALFGRSKIDCYQELKKIPIIHLHGKLGNLPWENKNYSFEFGEEIRNEDKLSELSSTIRIIHENVEDDSIFNEAIETLESSKKIYLLGFGYNQRNIDRLKLNSLPLKVIGSGFKFTEMEIEDIMSNNRNIQIENCFNDCLQFLRNNNIIK